MNLGYVSTYPPTMCGLATFTTALRAELLDLGVRGRVVRLLEGPQPGAGPEVVGDLVAGRPGSAERAARLLDPCDVAVVQHEYGIFGGPDGDEALQLLAALRIPAVVVLHTVLTEPTPHQKQVLEEVVRLASAVVTMTWTAHDRLADGYAVDMTKVSVIPHGAPAVRNSATRSAADRPTVLTWGLIGPGKGIEWAIDAMASLVDLDPAPRYVVAGQTHPKVLANQGEAYREQLQRQVRDLGLSGSVVIDGRYRDAAALERLVASADVVLLPYDSTDQVTSGVLIEAVASVTPVVATRFPHAVELLGGGAGLIVPQQDPAAIADALRAVLTDPALAADMTRAAGATAPDLLWPSVAGRYLSLARKLVEARVAA